MALYIPQSILHLARSLYVRPETYGPTYIYIYIYIYICVCVSNTAYNWQIVCVRVCVCVYGGGEESGSATKVKTEPEFDSSKGHEWCVRISRYCSLNFVANMLQKFRIELRLPECLSCTIACQRKSFAWKSNLEGEIASSFRRIFKQYFINILRSILLLLCGFSYDWVLYDPR